VTDLNRLFEQLIQLTHCAVTMRDQWIPVQLVRRFMEQAPGRLELQKPRVAIYRKGKTIGVADSVDHTQQLDHLFLRCDARPCLDEGDTNTIRIGKAHRHALLCKLTYIADDLTNRWQTRSQSKTWKGHCDSADWKTSECEPLNFSCLSGRRVNGVCSTRLSCSAWATLSNSLEGAECTCIAPSGAKQIIGNISSLKPGAL
jgi:hypothetical protein